MNLTCIFSCFLLLLTGYVEPVREVDFAKRLSAFYATVKTIQADFVQEKESLLFDEALVSKGKFFFERPDRVRWEQSIPSKSYYIFKQDEFIEFDGKTLKQSKATSPQLTVFRDFILKTVDGSILNDPAFSKTFKSENGKMQIRLVPVDKRLAKRLTTIDLVFDEKSLLLDQLTLAEASQERTQIRFVNQQVNSPIASSLFSK